MKLALQLLLSLCVAAAAAPARSSEAIAKKARCVACHAADRKLVGPAFRSVAAKYRDQPEAQQRLREKVRGGGMGSWGEIPMPAHPPDKISDDDLKSMIDWILKLE